MYLAGSSGITADQISLSSDLIVLSGSVSLQVKEHRLQNITDQTVRPSTFPACSTRMLASVAEQRGHDMSNGLTLKVTD